MPFLFNPRKICVIGASSNRKKVGFAIFNNILKNGFKGIVYPVNWKEKSVLGKRCYFNVSSIPDKPDLAIIAIPAPNVPLVVEECGRKGIKNIVIISAGFREVGVSGQRLEEELKKISQIYNIKILGPNTLGFINTYLNLNASFTEIFPPRGEIAFISQSGALCSAALDIAKSNNIGFSYLVSLGNELNLKEIEVIQQLAKDKKTKVIAAYLEEISDSKLFQKYAPLIIKEKPLIILKAGKTKSGSKAVSSHTGSLAGSWQGAKCLLDKIGAISVNNLEELINLSLALVYQNKNSNFQIAIVTNAGGPGVLTTDYCLKNNLSLANLSKKTKNQLKKVLPPAANYHNPIDIIGDADAARYYQTLKIITRDKNVGIILVILTPQTMTEIEKTAQMIIKISKNYRGIIIPVFMGGEKIKKAAFLFNRNRLPNFVYPEKAVKCLSYIKNYQEINTRISLSNTSQFRFKKQDYEKIQSILSNKKGFLSLEEIYPLIKALKLPYLKSIIVRDEKEALKMASKISFPLALRIVSKTIIHKTDVGGVILGIKNKNSLKKAFQKIKQSLKEKNLLSQILAFEISEMTPEGLSVIIGIKKDKLGHLIMFGWGGIYTEILRDIAFKMVPLNKKEALDLIKKTKVYHVLKGARGGPIYDLSKVVDVLVKISNLAFNFPQISELDINPLKVYPSGGKIIDIKIKLD